MRWWARGPLFPFVSVGLVAMALLLALSLGRPRARPASQCIPVPEGWATDTRDKERGPPTPQEPFPGQKRAPCDVPPETEVAGGCWVELRQTPPCGRIAYENAGRCLMPVLAAKPTPVSGQ